MLRTWGISLLLWTASPSYAADYCDDQDLVLDIQTTWDFHAGFSQSYGLPTHREDQLYPTKALLSISSFADDNTLDSTFTFPAAPNQVGLAYNLYRLQIQIGEDSDPDRQIIDQDYTADCSGAGASLWPGEKLALKPIPISAHADASPRGRESVHLRFWGK